MTVFGPYSRYYDLLYRDKDYLKEAAYINSLINKYLPGAGTILDLGCGTGRHAGELVRLGFQVHGVDLSREMLEKAMLINSGRNISFSEGDVRKVRLNKNFAVVTALFHVISYLTTNEDVLNTFKTAYKHLNDGGIFIFDCWYGPAVLSERPEVRVKRLEDDEIEITRISEPLMHENDTAVDVNYHVFIREKKNGSVEEIKETHRMRYFFIPEIFMFLNNAGFTPEGAFKFLTMSEPGGQDWNAVFIGRKSRNDS